MRVSEVGFEFRRMLELRDRFGTLPLFCEDLSEIVVGLRILRSGGGSLLQQLNGLVESLLLPSNNSEMQQRRRGFRLEAQGFLKLG